MKNEVVKYFSSDPQKGNLRLSNAVLRSKKKATLLEGKIEVLAMKKLDFNPVTIEKTDNYGNPYLVDSVDINMREIRMLTGRNGGSLYEDVKKVALEMAPRISYAEDPDLKQFVVIPMYNAVTYNNGVLHIEFSNEASPYLKDVKTNYTNISVPILFTFQTNGGFYLYKKLRTYTYMLKKIDMRLSQEEQPEIAKQYGVDELKVELGYIDLEENDEIKHEVHKPRPDWNGLVALSANPMYNKWTDFKTRVIEPGIAEINNISDIYITPEYVRTGAGAKVTDVIFHIQMNKKYYEAGFTEDENYEVVASIADKVDVVKEITPIATDDIAKVMKMMRKHKINAVQAELLINEANGDIALIKKAYDLSKKQAHIDNFMGWMRSAIKRNAYEESEPIETVYGSVEAAQSRNSAADKVWAKAQQDELFPLFQQYVMEEYGDMEAFDILLDTAEKKFKEFANWKIKKIKEK